MLLDANAPARPAGVLVDHGTGKRIPYARKANLETGEYEAFVLAPNGTDILCDENRQPIVRKGQAVGRLELVPFGDARLLGTDLQPKVSEFLVQPMGKDEKIAGLETYKRCFVQVFNELRGEARKTVDSRWEDFLKTNDFLDEFVITTKRSTHVKGLANVQPSGSD